MNLSEASPPQEPPRQWQLARARLRLPAGLWNQRKALAAISAPPGYGKSTLLSQWREEFAAHDYRVVTLTASAADRNGDKVVVDLADAVGRHELSTNDSLLNSYGAEGKVALVKALMAEFEAEGPAALMIDDIHEMADDDSAQSVLRLLVDHQPDDLVIVLSSRTHPPAAVSRALLEGRLHHVTERQLAFTEEEAAELLRQHGIEPRQRLVERLHEHTQGWPAVVRLFALSLSEDEARQDAFVRELGANPRALTDYLNESLFAHLPHHIYDFLLQLSVLPGFTVPLAVAVTGRTDAAEILDDLERRALPISRSGGADAEYVLHPLVREYLADRLKRGDGEELQRSRDRARDWLVAQGRVDTAIEVCLNAGDINGAATLINEHARMMVQQYGRHTTYLYWINKLPREALTRFPEIQLKAAWSLNFCRRHEEAEAMRRDLEQQLREAGAADGGPPAYYEQALELQRCVQAGLRDQALTSTSRTEKWLARWPEGDPFDRAAAHAVLAFSNKALGDFERGLAHARRAQELGRQCRAPYICTWANMLVIANLTKQGHYRQALHECEEYIEQLTPELGERACAVMMLHAMRAGLLYEFNRLAEVGSALDRGLTALIEQASADPMIMAYVTLARVQRVQGDYLDALETLAEGEVLGRANGLPRLAIALGAERVVLLLRQGELAQAERLWEEIRDAPADNASADNFERALADKAGRLRARMALVRGDYRDVESQVAASLERARDTGQKRKQTEISLLQAVARYRDNRLDDALSALREAVNVAMPEAYVRTFVEEGEPVKALLQAYIDRDQAELGPSTRAYVGQLIDAMDAAETPTDSDDTVPAGSESMVEPLTSRELQILSKLPPGPSNRQLSDALFITEGTLKWHLRNIYGKLGVTNRLAAVDKARELGLVED